MLKAYFKLNNLRLCNNIIKAVQAQTFPVRAVAVAAVWLLIMLCRLYTTSQGPNKWPTTTTSDAERCSKRTTQR